MDNIKKIEISHRTIIFTLGLLLGLWLVYQVRGVILLVFIAVILMSALNPGVDWLEKYRIPRLISILVFYILIIGGVSGLIAMLIPPLVEQTSKLVATAPHLLGNLSWLQINPGVIVEKLSSLPADVLKLAMSAISNIIVVFTVLVFTFYLLLERKHLKNHLTVAFGSDGEVKAEKFVDRIEASLGRWIRGQLFNMTLVGLLCYLGLMLLGVDFALPLAILAALFEIIPNMGPIVSSIPAVILGLAVSPTLALGVGALYFAIQQLQAQVITPNVMRHAVGFNPLATMVALMSGYAVAGVAGAILALPTILVLQVIWETVRPSKT